MNFGSFGIGALSYSQLRVQKMHAGLMWHFADLIYRAANVATVMLLGVAMKNEIITANLLLGSLFWGFLSNTFMELGYAVAYERWDGTAEHSFSAPVPRASFLLGSATTGAMISAIESVIIGVSLAWLFGVPIQDANFVGLAVTAVAALPIVLGLGICASTFPLISAEYGAQGVQIVLGVLMLLSGVYFPSTVLPEPLQTIASWSPGSVALEVARSFLGIGYHDTDIVKMPVATLSSHYSTILWLAGAGVLSILVSLKVFDIAERYTKKRGGLSRNG